MHKQYYGNKTIVNEFDKQGLILKRLTKAQLERLEKKLANERKILVDQGVIVG